MKKILLFALIILALSSCTEMNYYQIAKTTSNNVKNTEKGFIYEDDMVRVTYYLWGEKGIVNFSIYNKSQRAIYVDWSKCKFILNGTPYSYFKDIEKTNTEGVSLTNNYNTGFNNIFLPNSQSLGFSAYTSEKIKAEKIVQIPPSSGILIGKFKVGKLSEKFPNKFPVKRKENKKIDKETYTTNYTKESTPVVFRNYLSYSLNERVDKEEDYKIIDNEFWVSDVIHFTDNGESKAKYVEYNSKKFSYDPKFENSNSAYYNTLHIKTLTQKNKKNLKCGSYCFGGAGIAIALLVIFNSL